MSEYHKIQTVYLRDIENNCKTLLMGQYATPEFEYLCDNKWLFTEKVNGTNTRVIFDGENIRFGGKTDNAQISVKLLDKLTEKFLPKLDLFKEKFPGGCVLYGEGYGAKICKGGGNYRDDQDFVLFDVNIDGWWLERDNLEDIADTLLIDIVPVIGFGTLGSMVAMVQEGFESEWGSFQAEGVVAKPGVELVARNGDRIITKIKCKDFAK